MAGDDTAGEVDHKRRAAATGRPLWTWRGAR